MTGVNHQRREINSIGAMLSVMASARHDPFARRLNVDLIAVLVALFLGGFKKIKAFFTKKREPTAREL